MPKGKIATMRVDELKLDPALQMRARGTNLDHVEDLAAAARKGAALPRPSVVRVEGKGNLVADGFHTVTALRLAGRKTVEVRIRDGTWTDAVVEASGANHHENAALKRSAEDKRRAVENLLAELAAAGEHWSIAKTAAHVGVSDALVRAVRAKLPGPTPKNEGVDEAEDETPAEPVYAEGRDGKKRRVKATNGTPAKPAYNWPAFEAAAGVVHRAPDDLLRAYPDADHTAHYQSVTRLLVEAAKAMDKWKKALNQKGNHGPK